MRNVPTLLLAWAIRETTTDLGFWRLWLLCFNRQRSSKPPPARQEFFAVIYLLKAAMFGTQRPVRLVSAVTTD